MCFEVDAIVVGIYFALMGSASELLYTLEWSFMVGLGFCMVSFFFGESAL